MPTVTASTPMPIMPLLPEFDSLSDDETGLSTRFYAALYATAHRFVTGVRAKRSYAEAYVSALTHYLQTFTACDYFTLLEIEVKAGRTESAAERARCVRSRRAARAALDQLGARLPESVHNTLVSFVVLGGRCGRLAA